MFDPEAISIQEVWAALILPFQVWYPWGAELSWVPGVVSCPRTHLWAWASPCLRCFWPQRCNLASVQESGDDMFSIVQPISQDPVVNWTPSCSIMFIGLNRTTQFFRLFEGPSVCWASQENTSSKELLAWSHSPYSPRCWCGISGIGGPPLRFLSGKCWPSVFAWHSSQVGWRDFQEAISRNLATDLNLLRLEFPVPKAKLPMLFHWHTDMVGNARCRTRRIRWDIQRQREIWKHERDLRSITKPTAKLNWRRGFCYLRFFFSGPGRYPQICQNIIEYFTSTVLELWDDLRCNEDVFHVPDAQHHLWEDGSSRAFLARLKLGEHRSSGFAGRRSIWPAWSCWTLIAPSLTSRVWISKLKEVDFGENSRPGAELCAAGDRV